MSEREGTPEEFADLAAALRGGPAGKRQAHRELVEMAHSAEPEEPDVSDDEAARRDHVTRLMAPKAHHVALVDLLHGGGDE